MDVEYRIELRLNGILVGDVRQIAQNLTWRRCRTATGVDEIDFILNDKEFADWCEERGTTIQEMLTPYALDARVIRNGRAVAGGFLATMPAYHWLAYISDRHRFRPHLPTKWSWDGLRTRKCAPRTQGSRSDSRRGASRHWRPSRKHSTITRQSKKLSCKDATTSQAQGNSMSYSTQTAVTTSRTNSVATLPPGN